MLPLVSNGSNRTLTFKRGDRVEIIEEFRDRGDEDFRWVVVGDEEKGRVDICPFDISMDIKPTYTVQTSWIRPERPTT